MSGVLVLLSALPVGYALARLGADERWAVLSDRAAVELKPMVPGLLVVGNAAKPLFAVLALGLVLLLARVSRRRAAVFVLVVAASNLTVQLLKHPLVVARPDLGGLNPLSGHVGLVAGVCLAWLVVVPPRLRAPSLWASAVALATVSAGVVAAGWHTPAQVVCGLLVAVGWSLVGATFRTPSGDRSVPHRRGVAVLLAGAAVAAVGLWTFAAWSDRAPDRVLPVAVVLAVVVGCGAGVAAVGAALALGAVAPASTRDRHHPGDPGEQSGTATRSRPSEPSSAAEDVGARS